MYAESFTEMDALSKRLATEAYGWPAVLGSGGREARILKHHVMIKIRQI